MSPTRQHATSWLLLLLGCCSSATVTLSDHLSLPLRRNPKVAGAPRAGRRLWRRSAGPDLDALLGDRRLYQEMASVTKEDDGVYFTTICIGGAQCFTVIVDTGSSTIAVPCKGCNCGSTHHYFASSDSKTVSDTGRTYSQCYGEGSCNRGKLLEDFICFGKDCPTDEGVKHAFGCCSTFSYNFRIQNADGIIGISPSGRTLVKDLAAHHKLDENEFALCFGVNGGELTVGGFDESLVTFRAENTSESGSTVGGGGNGGVRIRRTSSSVSDRDALLSWTDVTTRDNFYRVSLVSILVDGQPLDGFSTSSPMVDSGSTFSFMRSSNWGRLRDAFTSFCDGTEMPVSGSDEGSDNNSDEAGSSTRTLRCTSEAERNPPGSEAGDSTTTPGCWKFSKDAAKRRSQMATFPSMSFQLASSTSTPGTTAPVMCIPAHQYFFLSGAEASVYCVGVFKDSQDVIGANLLENFMAVFQSSPSRLGLARAPCDWALGERTGRPGSVVDIGPCASVEGIGVPLVDPSADTKMWVAAALGSILTLVLLFFGCRKVWRRRAVKYTQLGTPGSHVVVTHPGLPGNRRTVSTDSSSSTKKKGQNKALAISGSSSGGYTDEGGGVELTSVAVAEEMYRDEAEDGEDDGVNKFNEEDDEGVVVDGSSEEDE